jgi:glycosyltransferase involved in cell wall biosynthesis
MINFIIPSIGRTTLKRTLESLINQSNPNWECWVGFDGLAEEEVDKNILVNDDRIHYLYIKDKLGTFFYNSGVNHNTGNAGLVRNYIISNIDNNYEWVGFVDDDDSLKSYYIEKLVEEINRTSFDCCIFRMNANGNIIPPLGMNKVIQNFVGISFCVKKKFLENKQIQFINSPSEDYTMLESINNAGGEIYLSEYVTYNVLGDGER